MNKPVIKKKSQDGFAEVSFSESASSEKPPENLAEEKKEAVVGTNPLTQKPIIKSIEKKPQIKGIVEKEDDEERLVNDLSVAELRRKQVQDITPISNAPSEEQRELSPADLAKKIWEEKEKKKSWHHKLMGRFGFR